MAVVQTQKTVSHQRARQSDQNLFNISNKWGPSLQRSSAFSEWDPLTMTAQVRACRHAAHRRDLLLPSPLRWCSRRCGTKPAVPRLRAREPQPKDGDPRGHHSRKKKRSRKPCKLYTPKTLILAVCW